MDRLKYLFVWLNRIGYCRGFGIQSPTDYSFVRYVINEHWPYYQYDELGQRDDWLKRKLGRLYFRIANWRQPKIIESDSYQGYLQAGCRRAEFGKSTELILLSLDGDCFSSLADIYNKVEENTVLIVEGICRHKPLWQQLKADSRSVITFDLYYCGLVFFDQKRHKQNYIINF